MRQPLYFPRLPAILAIAMIASFLLLAGCAGVPTPLEKQMQHDFQSVERVYRPKGERPDLPVLDANASGAIKH